MELDRRDSPFAHVVCSAVFAPEVTARLLDRLGSLRWTVETEFDCRFERAASEEIIDLVFDEGGLGRLRQAAERVQALEGVSPAIAVQRYGEGAKIAPHTDGGVREVRVVVNLNQGWSVKQGGIWILAKGRDLLAPRRCLAPLSNTGFAFAPAEQSFHAMTSVRRNTSYAIVAAFPVRRASKAPHR